MEENLFPVPAGVHPDDPILQLPKVSLHDHLDGGLRPATIIELAAGADVELPADNPEKLGEWFRTQADSGSLPEYLKTFGVTVGVLQSAEALTRAAREWTLDQVADGVFYAECRWAPEQHVAGDLTMDDAVHAVEKGMEEGVALATQEGRTIITAQILTAMRQNDNSLAVAELALRHRDSGVVGFDLAGPEDGFPASAHRAALDLLRGELFPTTLHAGEDGGLQSMMDAVAVCGAVRIGHGVDIVQDMQITDGAGEIGRLAAWVLDRQIPLEVCPSSNIQTGAARSIESHPITGLKDLGFNVTVNPDNRLMSQTSVTREMRLLVEHAGWDIIDLEIATTAALRAAFIPLDVRDRLLEEIVVPGFERIDL